MAKQLDKNEIPKGKVSILKNQKIIIIAILLIVLIILIPIGYALFSHTKNDETSTKIGELNVILVEDWPEPGDTYTPPSDGTTTPDDETYDEFGISKKTKSIHGESVAELNAYVRVRLIPIVEYFVEDNENPGEGEWITAPVSQDKFVINVTGDTWTKSGDYWYYKKILKGLQNAEGPYVTDDMNLSWQVAEIPSEIASYPIRTNVRVLLEYAQTTNDMWKELFQIEQLPQGVQTVEEFEASLGE